MADKCLIINADDAGYAETTDQEILKLAESGIVTSFSVLMNGNSRDFFLGRVAEYGKSIDTGMHLNLTEGRPLSSMSKVRSLLNKKGEFHGLEGFLRYWMLKKIDANEVRREIEAQVQKAGDYSLELSHVDSHHNIHLLPGICRIIAESLEGIDTSWFRYSSPTLQGLGVFNSRNIKYKLFNLVTRKSGRDFKGRGMKTTDAVIQLDMESGKIDIENFYSLFADISWNSVELVCHPFYESAGYGVSCKTIARRRAEQELLFSIDSDTLFKRTGFRLCRRMDI